MNLISRRRCLAAVVLAFAGPAWPAAPPQVLITSPAPGQPAFGVIEFAAEVRSDDDLEVLAFFVDGEKVGEVTTPPYSLGVDVGDENQEHRFLVRAVTRGGESGDDILVTPAFRVDETFDARLQQLYVTVLEDRRRVLDLGKNDFTVFDNGVRQHVVTFERGDVPLAATILVDASASMLGSRLGLALRGAAVLAEAVRQGDEVSIRLFSDRSLYASPFSDDPEVITAGLSSVEARGGTALNDQLFLALRELETRQGRRVVILLSDGIDSHSVLEMSDVKWLARRSRAMIYWIRLDPVDQSIARFSSWKNSKGYRVEYRQLTDTVVESGGRIVTLAGIEQAEAAVREILDELHEQYVLGYYPSTALSDGSWHRVNVRAADRGLDVRTRGGYVDY